MELSPLSSSWGGAVPRWSLRLSQLKSGLSSFPEPQHVESPGWSRSALPLGEASGTHLTSPVSSESCFLGPKPTLAARAPEGPPLTMSHVVLPLPHIAVAADSVHLVSQSILLGLPVPRLPQGL